ncbi:MAG: hypothetical protein QOI36_214 [Pseudonocardiales bacterium]|jgi:hypothetical protein|nr:hypothetical protein [Pseudonocardiales bacterium]
MLGLGGGAFGPPGQLTGDPPHHGLGFVAGLSCRSHSFAPISRARVPASGCDRVPGYRVAPPGAFVVEPGLRGVVEERDALEDSGT